MTRDDILRMAREAELHCHMKLTEHGLVVEDLEHFAALVAAAALAEQAHDDAVYWYVGTDGKYYSSSEAELFLDANTKALYKKPPQWRLDKCDLIPLVAYRPRNPLTDEKIDEIAIKCLNAPELGWNRNLARAIEHAHGIKENP